MSPSTQENDFGGTPEERIARLIFYATRHGIILSTMNESLVDVRARLASLEEDRHRRAVEDAREGERDVALKKALADLQQEVKGMKGVVVKAAVVVLGTVLVALVKWVLTGNLSGVL